MPDPPTTKTATQQSSVSPQAPPPPQISRQRQQISHTITSQMIQDARVSGDIIRIRNDGQLLDPGRDRPVAASTPLQPNNGKHSLCNLLLNSNN